LEASRIEYRLKHYKGKWRNPIHLTVSPEKDFWDMPYPQLRANVYRVLKAVGIVGGSVIYHPFRTKPLRYSPHFHVLGYGWHNGRSISGWVIKNLGIRKSVRATALYQLSHAGVHHGFHTITWFGKLAYNVLKVSPMEDFEPICPLCKRKLVPLVYVATNGLSPPEEEGDYWLSRSDWCERSGYMR
jgi:hypothetical protein